MNFIYKCYDFTDQLNIKIKILYLNIHKKYKKYIQFYKIPDIGKMN